ncbi:MAG: hypothetical protein GF383_15785 [Candidatus Lokiarchaeota archaeon]|nr:hypothetical protein [Candidatus Lokiarchaeota archaeon]MBD3343161.1 hypothetical protein [Candidatus Lokiarchaeota archaeon]
MKRKHTKRILLIFLLAFPTALLFGFLLTNAHAESYIPEHADDKPKNNWHWGVDEGDIIMYEFTYEAINLSDSDQTRMKGKYVKAMNISSIANVSDSYMGLISGDFSHLNVTNVYWNYSADEWVEYDDDYTISEARYDDTAGSPEIYVEFGDGLNFFVLPKNQTAFNATDIAGSVNRTLEMYYLAGYVNDFNEYITEDSVSNNQKIAFSNTTMDHYLNLTYYDNGTLKYGDLSIKISTDQAWSDWMQVNMKIERVFDWNVTNDVEWSVEEEDVLYVGNNEKYPEGEIEPVYEEIKIEITAINSSYYEYQGMSEDEIVRMLFENVYADLFKWNRENEEYELILEDQLIACANNYYPFLLLQLLAGDSKMLALMPKDTTPSDLELIFDNNTYFMEERLESKKAYLGSDGYIRLENEDITMQREFQFDLETGILKWFYQYNSTERLMAGFRKNSTILTTGSGTFDLWSDVVTEWDLSMDYTCSSDAEIYWSVQKQNIAFDRSLEYNPWKLPEPNQIYIDVYTNASGDFSYPVEFTLSYSDTLESAVGVNESALRPYYYDFENDEWVLVSNNYFNLDTENNEIKFDLIQDAWGSYLTIGYASDANVSWSVDIGDVLYLGKREPGNNNVVPVRMEILYFNNSYIESVDDTPFGSNGGPQNQVFSNVVANVSDWTYNDGGYWQEPTEMIIASSNNYWAVGPHMLGANSPPPSLLPIGTNGTDVKDVFDGLDFWDQLNTGVDWVYFYNTTADVPFMANWSYATGEISLLAGYMYMDQGWDSFTYYRYKEAIYESNTYTDISLDSDLVDKWTLTVNFTCSDDELVLWKILPVNPVQHIKLMNYLPENASLFFDIFVNNTETISSVNLTIDYGSAETSLNAVGIYAEDLNPYGLDPDFNIWNPAPLDAFDLDETDKEIYSFSLEEAGAVLYAIGTSMTSRMDWSVEIGDILYYGGQPYVEQSGTEKGFVKIEITNINETGELVDLEEAGVDYSEMPQNQSFSLVWGDFSHWNNTAREWINEGVQLMAAANNYFPTAPTGIYEAIDSGSGGPIYLIPLGFSGTDIADSFISCRITNYTVDDSGGEYIHLIYPEDTTKFVKLYFDDETGIVKDYFGYDQHPISFDWIYFAGWNLKNETFTAGDYDYIVDGFGLEQLNVNITSNITITGGNFDLFSHIFTYEPGETQIGRGTPIIYMDLLGINFTNNIHRFNFTIELPTSIDLSEVTIDLWRYELNDINDPNDDDWGRHPDPIGDGALVINESENYIVVKFSTEGGSGGSLFAVSYYTPSPPAPPPPAGDDDDDDDDDDIPAAIPGFEIYLLFASIAVISLLIIEKRRKLIK